MNHYPAIDVRTGSSDLLLAIVDDFGPIAAEERGDTVRVFFPTAAARDAARNVLVSGFEVTAIDVPDEDWARRSQHNLTPITVGRITVLPSPESRTPNPESRIPSPESRIPNPQSQVPNPIAIVIEPSMGFGTGHHVTTQLCLAALQTLDLRNLVVLDVGTGSGVLAIAADRLGAAQATGIDCDADAIQSARENLPLNPDARHVTFDEADLAAAGLPSADVVTANLTGTLLARSATALLAAVRPGGWLILSGILAHERDEIVRAMAPASVCWEREDEDWIGLAMKRS